MNMHNALAFALAFFSAVDRFYGDPRTLAATAALAVVAIGYARWELGPSIWSRFAQSARETLDFWICACTPWTWPRRWRARRARRDRPESGGF